MPRFDLMGSAFGATLFGSLVAAATLSVNPVVAIAQEVPVHMVADEVGYDEEFGLYVARGHVEAQRGDKIIMADTLTYNERTKTVTASGNVALLMPNGDTLFGNYVDVTEDFNDGIVQGFRALLSDDSRMAAASAQRIGGRQMILKNAVYTPCLPCKTDPSRQPLWQVKARDVVQDSDEQTITYHNAWMEMFGVPVFWTPYFQHPEPGVARMSGLLEPRFSVSSGRAGVQYAQPYFFTLGTDKDVTVTPILRVDGGPDPAAGVGDVEYRQRFRDGALRVEGSGTYEDRLGNEDRSIVKNNEFRGHFEGDGLFEINRDWRWGFNSKLTTDKTYLSQYHFGSPDWLENTLWAEGFFGRSYFDARAYGFQTTDKDFDSDNAPMVLPTISYNFVSEPSQYGAIWGINANVMNIVREEERDSLRFSVGPSWTLPYTSSMGDIYELKLAFQSDLYVVNDVDPDSDSVDPGGAGDFDGVSGRFFPEASLKWRYPFVRPGESITQIFQPIAQLVLAPDCCNTGEIPNEDSRTFEWDDTKVFDTDRFAGLDRVDSGSRFNYGVQWTGYVADGGYADVFLGQSVRFWEDGKEVRRGSGIDEDLSDLVGRVTLVPADWLDLNYRFRLDADDFDMKRQDLGIVAGPDEFRANIHYIQLENDVSIDKEEQISGGFRLELGEYWAVGAQAYYDIRDDDFIGFNSLLEYQDECFGLTLNTSYAPEDDDEEDSAGDFTAMIQFRFTNLGNIGSNF
ncbi:MAG: LPS-assembly protein LptD [Rhodospirillaceae bacterium]|nr:LPS-assembly protein LptD [Rhodospirillaceae bacterium]